MKNIANLIFKHFLISFTILKEFFPLFCLFNCKILFSDKDNSLKRMLIIEGIMEQYIITAN